eukprot:469903_1
MSPLVTWICVFLVSTSHSHKSKSKKCVKKDGKDCSLPDFVLHAEEFNDIAIRTEYFPADDCQINEGCVNDIGERTVIRFVTAVGNIGTETFKVGNPAYSDLTIWDNCHSHYHVNNYVEYDVFCASDKKEKRPVAQGGKDGFCVQDGSTDTYYDGNDTEPSRFSNCSYQGIGIGRMDKYASHIICQFVDITDLPAGDYVLRGTVNKDKVTPELDYDNNEARVPFSYDGNPASYYISNFIPDQTILSEWANTKNNLLSGDSITVPGFPTNVPAGFVGWITLYRYGESEWCFSPGPCFSGQRLMEISYGLTQLCSYFDIEILLETAVYGNGYFYVEGHWTMQTVTNCLYPTVRTEFYVYFDENGEIVREIAIADDQNAFVLFEERVFFGNWICQHPTDYIIESNGLTTENVDVAAIKIDEKQFFKHDPHYFVGIIGNNVIKLSLNTVYILVGVIVVLVLLIIMALTFKCCRKRKTHMKIDWSDQDL